MSPAPPPGPTNTSDTPPPARRPRSVVATRDTEQSAGDARCRSMRARALPSTSWGGVRYIRGWRFTIGVTWVWRSRSGGCSLPEGADPGRSLPRSPIRDGDYSLCSFRAADVRLSGCSRSARGRGGRRGIAVRCSHCSTADGSGEVRPDGQRLRDECLSAGEADDDRVVAARCRPGPVVDLTVRCLVWRNERTPHAAHLRPPRAIGGMQIGHLANEAVLV